MKQDLKFLKYLVAQVVASGVKMDLKGTFTSKRVLSVF